MTGVDLTKAEDLFIELRRSFEVVDLERNMIDACHLLLLAIDKWMGGTAH
jgi:hypothetical protein